MNASNGRAGRSRSGRALVWVAVTCAGAAGVGGLVWVGGAFGNGRGEQGAMTADHAVVKKTGFDIVTIASGELEARNQIEIRSRLESRSQILELVPEGVRVQAGDVLVRLNADEIQTRLDEERSRVESARADLVAAENVYLIQLTDNESKLRRAKLAVELAKLALEQWESGDQVQKRKDLDLAVEKAERDLERLKDKYQRSEDLFTQGFLSKNERDTDRIALLEAEAAVSRARLLRETYVSYTRETDEKTRRSNVEDAEAEVKRVELNNAKELAVKDADRRNKAEQLSIRETKFAKLKEQFEFATMRAPADGLVVYATSTERGRGWSESGALQIGREVQPNQPLIYLPDTSEMVATVKVHESLAGRVRPGQSAVVRVDAVGGRTYAGKVESIGVLAESGGWRDPNLREYTVKVGIDADNTGDQLKPSMRCEAQITLGRVEDALAVPLQAVFNDGPVRFVYTPRQGKYARVPVRLGRRSESLAEIRTGLKDGDVVLLREPASGDVLAEPWPVAALTAAGYVVNDDGTIFDPLEAQNQQAPRRSGNEPRASETPPGQPGTPGAASAPGASVDGEHPQGPGGNRPASPRREGRRPDGGEPVRTPGP